MAEYPENTKQDMILPKIINRTLPLHAGGCIQQVPVLLPKFLEICTILLLTKAILPLKMLPQEANVGKISKSTTYSSMRTGARLPAKKINTDGQEGLPRHAADGDHVDMNLKFFLRPTTHPLHSEPFVKAFDFL